MEIPILSEPTEKALRANRLQVSKPVLDIISPSTQKHLAGIARSAEVSWVNAVAPLAKAFQTSDVFKASRMAGAAFAAGVAGSGTFDVLRNFGESWKHVTTGFMKDFGDFGVSFSITKQASSAFYTTPRVPIWEPPAAPQLFEPSPQPHEAFEEPDAYFHRTIRSTGTTLELRGRNIIMNFNNTEYHDSLHVSGDNHGQMVRGDNYGHQVEGDGNTVSTHVGSQPEAFANFALEVQRTMQVVQLPNTDREALARDIANLLEASKANDVPAAKSWASRVVRRLGQIVGNPLMSALAPVLGPLISAGVSLTTS